MAEYYILSFGFGGRGCVRKKRRPAEKKEGSGEVPSATLETNFLQECTALLSYREKKVVGGKRGGGGGGGWSK